MYSPDNNQQRKSDLNGKTAIVTGGGRGIGQKVAQSMAEAGARVLVTARTKHELDQTVKLIKSSGGDAIAVSGDVSNPLNVEKVVKVAENQFGVVDILVNNAGIIGPIANDWESDPMDWWHTMEVNMLGTYLMTRSVLPGMISRNHGRIINITSAVTMRTIPHFAPYTASKAAIIYYTQNLAKQVKSHGVSVFAYHPGGPDTDMSRHLAESPKVHESVSGIFKKLYENDAHTPIEIPVGDIMMMASGESDALTGRFLIHTDDQKDMLTRIDEIEENDLYVLTRRT